MICYRKANASFSDMISKNICPIFISELLFDYYSEHEKWTSADEIIQWRIKDRSFMKLYIKGFIKYDLRDYETIIRQFIEIQRSVKSIHITEITPEEGPNVEYEGFPWLLSLFKNLESIEVDENDRGYYATNGILYRAQIGQNKRQNHNIVIKCPVAYPAQYIHLDSSVNKTGAYSFFGLRNVKEIEMENCSCISEYSFLESNIERIALQGEGIYIRGWAFHNCNAIINIDVKTIEECAVYENSLSKSYEKLLLSWAEESGYMGPIDKIMKFGCCGENVWIYEDEEDGHVIGSGKMWDYSQEYYGNSSFGFDKRLIIHDGVRTIGKYAFWKCIFNEILIGRSVEDVQEGAFQWGICHMINFPGNIKHIGSALFCTDPCMVDRIIISTDIERIDPSAFFWRAGGPEEIILTGETPPNWIMWLRSGLFDWLGEDDKVFFPTKWMRTCTQEYFGKIRKDLIDYWPEVEEENENENDWSRFDDETERRIDFINKFEHDIYNNSYDHKKIWIPYEDYDELISSL